MDLQKEKEELVEMFGIHFETLYHLPPLASRILGILIVDGNKCEMTFESLVDYTNASKSSVSTSLNLLLKIGNITYYTLPGDRKKYYRSSPFSERMSTYVKVIEFEKEIIKRMIAYREKTATTPEELINLQHTLEYERHVLQKEELLLRSIEKFKEIEKK